MAISQTPLTATPTATIINDETKQLESVSPFLSNLKRISTVISGVAAMSGSLPQRVLEDAQFRGLQTRMTYIHLSWTSIIHDLIKSIDPLVSTSL